MADATRVDNRDGAQSRLNGFSARLAKIGETGVIIITHALFRRIKSFANRGTFVQVVANVSVSVNYSRRHESHG